MRLYKKLSQAEFVAFAASKGWTTEIPNPASETLPEAPVLTEGGKGLLPPVTVTTETSIRITIPECIIHGGSLALFYEDKIFPGGFSHSSAWLSRDIVEITNGICKYEMKEIVPLHVQDPCFLGMASHFGHFFVDMLDRLLKLEESGLAGRTLLACDLALFGQKPDAPPCVPQISELIGAMGIRLAPGQIVPLPKQRDYFAANLTVCTLRSQKPSIPAESFRILRERVSSHLDTQGESTSLFIGRSEVQKRIIVNQPALIDYLAKTHGFKTLFPEHLTISEAIKAFSAASRIILPIGSAKFNLIFCRPGTRVACVVPKGYARQDGGNGVITMVRHMCHALGLRPLFYECEIGERVPLLNSDLLIDEPAAGRMIEALDAML